MNRRGLMGMAAALALAAFVGVRSGTAETRTDSRAGCACCGSACACPACTCDEAKMGGGTARSCDCCGTADCCAAAAGTTANADACCR